MLVSTGQMIQTPAIWAHKTICVNVAWEVGKQMKSMPKANLIHILMDLCIGVSNLWRSIYCYTTVSIIPYHWLWWLVLMRVVLRMSKLCPSFCRLDQYLDMKMYVYTLIQNVGKLQECLAFGKCANIFFCTMVWHLGVNTSRADAIFIFTLQSIFTKSDTLSELIDLKRQWQINWWSWCTVTRGVGSMHGHGWR